MAIPRHRLTGGSLSKGCPRQMSPFLKGTPDSANILPVVNYRHRGRGLASSLKGQNASSYNGADEKQQVQPHECGQVEDHGTLCCRIFINASGIIPIQSNYSLLAIRGSCADNKCSSLLLIRWHYFIHGCPSFLGPE